MIECGSNHHGMSAQPVNVRGQRTRNLSCTLAAGRERWPPHEVIREHRPPAQKHRGPVVLIIIAQAEPAVTRRHNQTTGADVPAQAGPASLPGPACTAPPARPAGRPRRSTRRRRPGRRHHGATRLGRGRRGRARRGTGARPRSPTLTAGPPRSRARAPGRAAAGSPGRSAVRLGRQHPQDPGDRAVAQRGVQARLRQPNSTTLDRGPETIRPRNSSTDWSRRSR